ncbi:MAG: metallophosphoesterase [Geminicoccaceae bacterium]
MFRLAHLTDLHLGPMPRAAPRELFNQRVLGYLSWRRRRYRVHRREVLDALVADLREQSPSHVAVTGDLVNISLPAEFVQARVWLDELGSPDWVTVVPGNHDAYITVRWNDALRNWAEYMCGDDGDPGHESRYFPFLRRRGDVALIGLSTAIATPPTFATGRLGPSQLASLERMLANLEGSGLCRVVLLHHPPVPTMTDYRRRLVDDEAFCALIRRHPVELVLCGHQHIFQLGEIRTAAGSVPVVGGPSASLHGGDRNYEGGYLLFDLERLRDIWQIRLELRRYDGATGRFGSVLTRQLGERTAGKPALATAGTA